MNLLDLFVKISVDMSEVDKNLGNTKEKALSFGDVLKANIAGQAIVSGVKAVAGAVKNIGEAAIQSYGEYEQLVGGVETLFNSSADTVMQYAANAYQTAGMSANEYMTTVTAFSASLLQSMGGDTDAAAEKANLAITDMSDNANKMGTDMQSIQNAYQGFSKQNYTMLDNLKLGYGGTKEEMQRLLDDANALNAAQGNYTNYTIDSYADIVDAIHTVQTEMGITGTTQLEASTTIQGSIASMKAAYENFITGLGDENADMAELITNLLGSAVTVAENLLPVVERILENIGVVVQEKGPEMIEKFVGYAVEKLPQVIELGMKMVLAIVSGLANNLPQIVRSVLDMLATIVETFVSSLPDIVNVGKQIVKGLWEGIKAMGSWIKEKVTGFFGGIVDGVKGVLGIHSPSRVFAGIGENMALGLGDGWDDEYGNIKRGITSGLDFGTASVGFADSGIGISSAAIVNGLGEGKQSGGSFTFNLMFPDMTKFASYVFDPLTGYAQANGTPILNPIA
nr:MAG TPA: tail tape measure protein [Caudoviricetes sp.]